MNIRYNIQGGVSLKQLDQMHATALRLIDQVGVNLADPGLRDRIKDATGVRVEGTRVRIAPEVVDGHIQAYRDKRRPDGPVEPSSHYQLQILTGFAFQLLDPKTNQLRPMTAQASVETARLVDALHEEGVVGGTPGLPADVPLQMRELHAQKIGFENSRTGGVGGFTSRRAANHARRMCEAMGIPFSLPAFVLSPLRVEGEAFEMALEFADSTPQVQIGIDAMPLLGVTTPIHPVGAFVECTATILATYTIYRLLGVQQDMSMGFDVYPFDLRIGAIVYGTPEHAIVDMLGRQVSRYYNGMHTVSKAFHTNALFADAQSLVQRASFATMAALDGARVFQFGGMLGIDKIFSPEQLLLDIETLRHIDKCVQGCRFDDETLAEEIISAVGPCGEYASNESTLNEFRNQWDSRLFDNNSPEMWEAGDRKVLRDRVLARLDELDGASDFALEPDKQQELDRIYAEAEKELLRN